MEKLNYALITGASQGLGRALAEECAGRGYNLVLVALAGSGLREVAAIIRLIYHVDVKVREMDLTETDGPGSLAEWIRSQELHLVMLINNAGIGYNRRFDESSLHENEATIALNVLALVKLTHLLLPLLAAEGAAQIAMPASWGRTLPGSGRRNSARAAYILNVGSLAAFFPMPFMPVYSPTKSFVLNFSLALREELAERGVSVSVLCPNGIRTNRGCREQIERQGVAGRLTCRYPDEVARAALSRLLRGKAVIVPGFLNKLIRGLAGLAPRALVTWIVSRHWGTARMCGAPSEQPQGVW